MASIPIAVSSGLGSKQNNSNGEKRKLVIKPLKREWGAGGLRSRSRVSCCSNWPCMHAVKPQLPANFEEETWSKLEDAVNAVHAKQPVAHSLEQLYRVRRRQQAPTAQQHQEVGAQSSQALCAVDDALPATTPAARSLVLVGVLAVQQSPQGSMMHAAAAFLPPSLPPCPQAVDDLCSHKLQAKLYARLTAALDAHLGCVMASLAGHTALEPVAFLERMDAAWGDHQQQLLTIRSIFLALDRSYVITLPGLRSLFDTGLSLLRAHLEAHPQVGGVWWWEGGRGSPGHPSRGAPPSCLPRQPPAVWATHSRQLPHQGTPHT
jgi:hypothetical protein